MRRYLAIVLFLTGLLFFLSCDEDPHGYTGPWQEVSTPGGEGHLSDCYFNSPTDGWACSHGGYNPDLILIHWNGAEWEEYQYPGWFDGYGTIRNLDMSDVFFTSPDDGWAVGFVSFENDVFFGFVLRHDGNDWYLFETDVSFYEIYGISEDDVWFLTGSNNSDLYHWNGVEFEYYNLYPGNYGLRAIAFGSTNEGLAVGDYKFIYHWDGVSWDLITYDAGTELDGVAYDTPTTAFIVGENTLIRWENDELHQNYDWDGWYEDVHFSSYDEGWMYGVETTGEYPQGHCFTWHWDGVEWTRVDVPEELRGEDIFAIDYNNAWIVGRHSGPYCCSWNYSNY